MMSDRALLTAQKVCGYTAVTAALMAIPTLMVGFGEVVPMLLIVVALMALFSWWWFGHTLEMRRVAESFKDRSSR